MLRMRQANQGQFCPWKRTPRIGGFKHYKNDSERRSSSSQWRQPGHLLLKGVCRVRPSTQAELDRSRYEQLLRLIGLGLRLSKDPDNAAIQGYWSELEEIKRRYLGNPPPKASEE